MAPADVYPRFDRFAQKLIGEQGAEGGGGGEGGGPKPPAISAAVWSTALVAAALVLVVIRALLDVPGGWGIEDFLGWVDSDKDAPGARLIALWTNAGVVPAAGLYLAIDTLVFVPVYATLALILTARLVGALAADASAGVRTIELWMRWLPLPVVALVATDLAENSLGLARIAPAMSLWAWLLCASAGLFGAMLLASRGLRTVVGELQSPALWAGVALALAVIALVAAGGSCRAGQPAEWQGWSSLSCAAHRAKYLWSAVVLGLLLLGLAAWVFGVLLRGDPDPASADPAVRQRAERAAARAALRSALWDIFVRSRYVLAALALFGGLSLVSNQPRDVMYAVAAAPWSGPQMAFRLGGLAGSLLVYALSALALWGLAFACWLWTRSVCEVVGAGVPARTAPAAEDTVARLWARALGLAPYGILVGLCVRVVSDSTVARHAALAMASPGGDVYTAIMASVAAFAAVTIALGLLYVRERVGRSQPLYYNAVDWLPWARKAGLLQSRTDIKYRMLGLITPRLMPLLAVAGIFVTRLIDLFPGQAVPSLAYPVIAFTIGLWLCCFGWLSILEVVRAIPWTVLLLVVVGALGLFGLTDNHRVWSPIDEQVSGSSLGLLAAAAALAAIALVAYWLVTALPRRRAERAQPLSRWLGFGAALALAAATAATLSAGNWLSPRRPLPESDARAAAEALKSRPTLELAMARWLASLCAGSTACNGGQAAPKLPVYFVTTEGGGIRAAGWTAAALDALTQQQPALPERTFSISGVSGGAVGATVFRSCLDDEQGRRRSDEQRKACIRAITTTDLVSPLLGAWMFEDALARIVPTSWCATPGCGFLSRAAWFEARLEEHGRALRKGLAAARAAILPTAPHRPYLLLNSTWVESGERAIASDLRIDSSAFPGARDQLAIAGHDLPQSTAAHNAARFPYTNPIGLLTARQADCDRRREAAASPGSPAAPGAADRVGCGHLADGGYFDNSGGQSTADALKALVKCLTPPTDAGAAAPAAPEAAAAPSAPDAFCTAPAFKPQRAWLKAHLLPSVLFIRNGVDPAAALGKDCSRADQPAASALGRQPGSCRSDRAEYRPEAPACATRFTLFVDALGPPLTLFNVAGLRAHGRLSEGNQRRAVLEAWAALAAPAGADSVPVITIDQVSDGVLYPLGWHLSPAAASGLERQAATCHLN